MTTKTTQQTVMTLAAFALCITALAGAQGRFPQRGNFQRQGAPGRAAGTTSANAGTNATRGLTSSGAVLNTGGAQMPVLYGVITGGNSNTGQILVQTQNGGTGLVVQVTNSTQIMAQATTTASNLQVNDMVECTMQSSGSGSTTTTSGTSTSAATSNATASSATSSGASSRTLNRTGSARQNSALQRPGFLTRGSGTNSAGGGFNSRAALAPQSFSVAGRITSTSPLAISTNGIGSTGLNLPPNARVTRFTQLSFSSLKLGDQVMVLGQTGSNGTFTAARIAVNRN